MKKIVRGNDFTLRIPVRKVVNGEQVAFPLPACTDIVVNIVNQYRRVALSYTIDTTEDNIINARVEGDAVSVGTYALEVRGKIFGNDWRSKEYEQFAIVDNNASGDTAFNGEFIEGEDSVEMNTALVILPPTAELTQLIDDANAAVEQAKQTDVTLKANEEGRISAEQQRTSAEVARVSAESRRSESEEVRNAAEVERMSNEDARKTAEAQRAEAEAQRAEAEKTRTANETARVAAEKQRATTFTELSANVDAAVSDANTAASAANTATDKANAEEGKRAEAEKQRVEAEATRKQNENTRLEAESERANNETARKTAEIARQNAEAERVNNENERKTSESNREFAEQQRVSAEIERTSNEDVRQVEESERVNGETARQTAEDERRTDEQERKANETERKAAETQRKEAEEVRTAAEAFRVSAEEQREADLATTKTNCEAATKKASDAASEATIATSKANSSAEKANAAAVAAENVDASLANDVLTVTDRNGESTSLQLASYAEVGDVVSEVKHLSETMGAYTDRPDIVLTAKETNKAISASGAKVNKSGWAIAEFTAEKGNVYLFKPNVIDESVCIFAEYIQSVETRGIDYTYTYNSDGTTATATATYLGATHTYTYTYAEDKSFAITDETGATVDALPMVYETKVGTYSPLVSLNADAELPKDGYCRYMSHFKGNSAIKVVVSYKVGVADLTMKVTRDGVLASVSTQLGNLSQKEDETRKKIDELHGNWVDVLFLADTTVYVDYKAVIIKGKTRTRLYPKQQLQFGGKQYGPFIPLLWADLSHLTSAIRLSYYKEGEAQGLFQGCNKISSLALNNLGISKNVTLRRMFSGCSSLQSLSIEGFDVSKVTSMYGMFSGCSSLQSLSIEGWDVSKVTSMNQIFYGCSSLQSLDLSGWNLESCKNIDYLGQYNFIPKTLKLGTGFFKCPATKASLHFTTWTDASVKESLVVNSYDRKANGLPDFTLTLSKQTKAVLSEDDIAAMTAKGYIIA
jgi:surface protein